MLSFLGCVQCEPIDVIKFGESISHPGREQRNSKKAKRFLGLGVYGHEIYGRRFQRRDVEEQKLTGATNKLRA